MIALVTRTTHGSFLTSKREEEREALINSQQLSLKMLIWVGRAELPFSIIFAFSSLTNAKLFIVRGTPKFHSSVTGEMEQLKIFF